VDFLLDAHGSVRALTDDTGQILSVGHYDAYGIPLATAGTRSNFGYNGEYYDPDLGLIYLRARFYDPTTGRFLNRDPYQGALEDPMSLNSYQFAGADPVNQIDPSGNFSLFELAATELLSRFTQNIQTFMRADNGSDAAIKTMVPIILALNYTASQYSAIQNANLGHSSQWASQELALLAALPYQIKLSKDLEKLVDESRNAAKTYKRWKGIVNFMSKGVGGTVTRTKQTALGIPNKINGFPELTQRTRLVFGSVFIKLTGNRYEDDKIANAMTLSIWAGTWHHHEVVGVMQAVDSSLHQFYHLGGATIYKSIYGEGYE
jgi:RHS repeat-associated protein